jgi:hypothetical protein
MKVAGLEILRCHAGWRIASAADGSGTEPIEEAIKAHSPRVPGGLLPAIIWGPPCGSG